MRYAYPYHPVTVGQQLPYQTPASIVEFGDHSEGMPLPLVKSHTDIYQVR
jgi:hypothetical protein